RSASRRCTGSIAWLLPAIASSRAASSAVCDFSVSLERSIGAPCGSVGRVGLGRPGQLAAGALHGDGRRGAQHDGRRRSVSLARHCGTLLGPELDAELVYLPLKLLQLREEVDDHPRAGEVHAVLLRELLDAAEKLDVAVGIPPRVPGGALRSD